MSEKEISQRKDYYWVLVQQEGSKTKLAVEVQNMLRQKSLDILKIQLVLIAASVSGFKFFGLPSGVAIIFVLIPSALVIVAMCLQLLALSGSEHWELFGESDAERKTDVGWANVIGKRVKGTRWATRSGFVLTYFAVPLFAMAILYA